MKKLSYTKISFGRLLMMLLFINLCNGQHKTQTFSSTSTFTVPNGVTQITVEAWGGGGRGSSLSSTINGGGGGGGGAYAKKLLTVVSGTTYTVTVGAGSSSTTAGGDSWFSSATTVMAKGGSSAADNSNSGANGGSNSTSIGDTTKSGGNGANGVVAAYGGGGGSSAGTSSNGNTASSATGATAPTGGGNGGSGKSLAEGNGTAGSAIGGGGGGGLRTTSGTRTGGTGGNGQIILSWEEPEMNVLGNGIAINDNDTSTATTNLTDFGSVNANSGSVINTYTIQNTGTAVLSLGSPLGNGTPTLTGSNPGDFSIVTAPPASIAPGGSATFSIKFTPTNTGTRKAIFTLNNTDSDENPYNFALKGTGTAPSMSVLGNNTAIADGSTTNSTSNWTDFLSVNIASSASRTYTISNVGNGALTLTGSPKVTLTGNADFSITTQPTSPLAASGTSTFTISFTPTSIGYKTATITIASDDPGTNKNPYTFTIEGDGIQAFFDTDGDGVYNNLDSDDDNDGIPDNVEQNYASSSVLSSQVQVTLLNETFGAGTSRSKIYSNIPTASTTYCYEDGTTAQSSEECDTDDDLNDGQYTVNYEAGTLAVASWAPDYWYQGVDHTPGDTNGRMAMFNATNDITEEFYRTVVQGVITNAPLTYSFYVLNLDRSNAPGIATRKRPNLTVEFRDLSNNLISSLNTGDITPTTATNLAGDWYLFSSTFTPTTTGFSIVFRNNQPGGEGNDLALDDINITQKLTDTDQDGIADVYDLDSDNDGIGDIIEDGWAAYSNGKDRMDLTSGTWVDANHNGWHDTAEAFYNASGSPKNFDGDAVPNYIDLDSDNDAKFDVDEAGLYNGDGDINGDGRGDGTDSDGDGILSPFDAFTGFGNTGKSTPANTLGTGNADYLKLSSQTGIKDISTTLYASLDANNDGVIDGNTDVDKDGILDAFDTNTSYYGSPRNLSRKLLLDFDGRNDYAEDSAILGGLANASIMAWIDLNSAFSAEGIVVGQSKFFLRVTSDKKIEAVVNSTTASYSTALTASQWYHVAAVYGGGSLKLYLNGNLVATQSASGSIATDATKLTLGRNPGGTDKYFKGKIDEVRVFNAALTDSQVQRMVYQEIQNTGGQVRGTIVPKDVSALPYVNLMRYYRMDTYKDDIIDDITTAAVDTGTGMKMYNHKNIYIQQAPMPFITERTGTFATAVNSPTNEIRGLDIMDQDWSIVQVKHNITETANNTDLGMLVDAGVTVSMTNDTKIQNDWYLLLNGKIDLVGKSQLVQTANSDLDAVSAGSLERDQQGQSNKYNYNYWSSPVSSISNTTNNIGYTIDGVMKDGTDPNNIQNIQWTGGYDGSATTPITISSIWLYKFQNYSNSYANWSAVGQSGSLAAGQGYTMKGSDAATATQNYTFVGKPNNGTITSPVSANNLNLCGNPYASAIDANAFITDNSSSITGTLYFWQHYSTNNSHVTAQYQGGYATRTLVGGTPPVAPAGVSGLGSSSKTPGRYIPVGQGFFVTGSATGGNITFNNSQRGFVREDSTTSNTMFKAANPVTAAAIDPEYDNHEDTYSQDQFMKIRLGYNSAEQFHRQILLGFMNQYATSGIDSGYDAISLEDLSNDMYFLNNDVKLNIQGDGYFDETKIFPLGVRNAVAGTVSFIVDGKEHFSADQNIYIYDQETNLYHDITSTNFEIELATGIFDNRFSLRFQDPSTLGVSDHELNASGISIIHSQANHMLNISNKTMESTIKTVELYNIMGQKITDWKVDSQDQTNIQLPITAVSSGTYVVKLTTNTGELSKKIVVNALGDNEKVKKTTTVLCEDE